VKPFKMRKVIFGRGLSPKSVFDKKTKSSKRTKVKDSSLDIASQRN